MKTKELIISEWLETAGKGSPTVFDLPREDFIKLWERLMLEEMEELKDAFYRGDKEEFVDACVDIHWVLHNITHVTGLIKLGIFDKAFDEVTKANFSKYCKTEEEAIESVKLYKELDVETYYKQVGDYFVIYRSSDDKILKSMNFQKPDYNWFKNFY